MFDSPPTLGMAFDTLRLFVETRDRFLIADAIAAVVFLMPDQDAKQMVKPLVQVWIEILRGKPFTRYHRQKLILALRTLEPRLCQTDYLHRY